MLRANYFRSNLLVRLLLAVLIKRKLVLMCKTFNTGSFKLIDLNLMS